MRKPKDTIEAAFAVTTWDDTSRRNQWYKRVSEDPVSDLSTDLPRWRNRSQFLHLSNVLVDSATQNFANQVIGKGLFVNPKPTDDTLTDIIKEDWSDWSDACHIDGQTDLASFLRATVAAIVRDGDVLIYLTANKDGDLKLDILAATRIDTPPASLIPKGRDVYLGVQVYKRYIEGYWVKNSFGDGGFTFFPTFDKDGNIKAVLLKNPANTARINSYRGIPLLSSCLSNVDKLDRLMDAELKASLYKTNQVGIYKAKNVGDASKAMNPLGSISAQKVGDTNIITIPNTDDLTLQNGSEVSNKELPATVKLYLQNIAAMYNVPFNVLYNALEDSSYSTNSAIFQIAWENTGIWRDYLIHNLLKPIYLIRLEALILSGAIKAPFDRSIKTVQFVGKPNIPIRAKDIFDSQATAIQSGQRSLIQVCSEYGVDAKQVIDDEISLAVYRKKVMLANGLSEIDMANVVSEPTQKVSETK